MTALLIILTIINILLYHFFVGYHRSNGRRYGVMYLQGLLYVFLIALGRSASDGGFGNYDPAGERLFGMPILITFVVLLVRSILALPTIYRREMVEKTVSVHVGNPEGRTLRSTPLDEWRDEIQIVPEGKWVRVPSKQLPTTPDEIAAVGTVFVAAAITDKMKEDKKNREFRNKQERYMTEALRRRKR